MANPVITIRSSDDSENVTTIPFYTINKGAESAEVTLHIWNNYGGVGTVDNATNCALAIKTSLGEDIGDTVPHGQELVTDKFVEAKCTSRGDSAFTPIGGAVTLPIGPAAGSQTLSGNISSPTNRVATVILKLNVPADAESASITFKIRVLYT